MLLKVALTILIVVVITQQMFAQRDFDSKVQSLLNETVPLIHVDELAKALDNKQLVLLDARSEEEYQVSRLNGAEFVDYKGFDASKVSHIPKDQEIVVYCSVGYRSEKIGEQLQELGYTNVKNLYGGIFDWKNKGHEVVNAEALATDSVHTYNKSWSKWLIEGIKVYE